MKKLIFCALALLICFSFFCSCGENAECERFVCVYVQNNGEAQIYVDIETKVQYVRISGGGFEVMVDENGKPLLYEGELG